jgi:uncharacterized membrane protein YfcA
LTFLDGLILFLVAFAAYAVKGFTGFGPALVLVPIGSLFFAPQSIIPLAALLNVVAGAMLLRVDWRRDGHTYWIPLVVAVVIGSVIGAFFLEMIPANSFRRVLGVAILLIGLWFLFLRSAVGPGGLSDRLPARPNAPDAGFAWFGGLLGGVIGISGPPIIWHFGRKLAKSPFRQAIVPIFLAATIARSITYASLGLVDGRVLVFSAVCLPGLFLGLYVGNRIFKRVSEKVFALGVGVLLVVIGARMLF